MKIKIIKSCDNWKSASNSYELNFQISDGLTIQHFYLSSWESPVSESNDIKQVETPSKITNFAEFQTANIARLSEAIAGMDGPTALKYLQEEIIERFAFEIWERKEKSWAAEMLKNQIKKTVEGEKGKILPEYKPENLSKASRSRTKIQTSSEQTKSKTIKMFEAMGISQADAEKAIADMMSQTFSKMGESSLPSVETPLPIKCPKCQAFILSGNECMICQTKVFDCECCSKKVSSLTEVKTRNGKMQACKECAGKPIQNGE